MTNISNQHFDGERPLYASRDLRLEHVTIGDGESGLKESRHIEAVDCEFKGMYIFWECEDIECRNCHFAASDRAPLWYGRNIRLADCRINGVKALRELDNIALERVRIKKAAETFWFCRNGQLTDLRMDNAEYAFFQANHLQITNLQIHGKYLFQYAQNIEIHNSVLCTKDAFWESRDCTIYDSDIKGEYLGWHAKNLRLVRCHIAGTQPLCYCENLILEDCTFAPDANLAFEYSSVRATIRGAVTSIKNPLTDTIVCDSVGEYILDEYRH